MSVHAAPERSRVYQTAIADSTRWEGFSLRAGDILVCTPPKTGTTWTQMLCALLVHQSATFPEPLTRLSRWLERHTEPVSDVAAHFDAQKFRRIVKTHTPLDGLPWRDDVSYVVCGRDPRDAFLSMLDHFENLSDASLADVEKRMGLPPGTGVPFPKDPNILFPLWMTNGAMAWMQDGFPFGSVFYFLKSFWDFRAQPNIFFLHYTDMTAHLDEEMRRLSKFLRIPVDEAKWPALVAAAKFQAMKTQGADDAPGAHLGEWRDPKEFFKMARMAQWREVLSPENQALYARLSAERYDAKFRAWLESGRSATGDPKAVL